MNKLKGNLPKLPPQPWFTLGACYLSASIAELILEAFLPIKSFLDSHRFASWAFGNANALSVIQRSLLEKQPIVSKHSVIGFEPLQIVIITAGNFEHTAVMTEQEFLGCNSGWINEQAFLNFVSEVSYARKPVV